jgi:hypothetical protein
MKTCSLQLFAILILSSVFAFTSCKKDENNEVISKNGLIPLKTGNSWTYLNYRSNVLTDTSKMGIGDFITLNGFSGFKLIQGSSYSFHPTFLIDNDSEGNFISVGGYSDIDTLFASSIQYKSRAAKGESWDFKELNFIQNGIFEAPVVKMFCLTTDTTILTPKGSFICNAYKWSPNSGDDVFIAFISNNIGLIKNVHYENNRLYTYQILLDYRIN